MLFKIFTSMQYNNVLPDGIFLQISEVFIEVRGMTMMRFIFQNIPEVLEFDTSVKSFFSNIDCYNKNLNKYSIHLKIFHFCLPQRDYTVNDHSFEI